MIIKLNVSGCPPCCGEIPPTECDFSACPDVVDQYAAHISMPNSPCTAFDGNRYINRISPTSCSWWNPIAPFFSIMLTWNGTQWVLSGADARGAKLHAWKAYGSTNKCSPGGTYSGFVNTGIGGGREDCNFAGATAEVV